MGEVIKDVQTNVQTKQESVVKFDVKDYIKDAEKPIDLLEDLPDLTSIILYNINTGDTDELKGKHELKVVNYLRKLTGIDFKEVYTDGESTSLVPLMLKRGHVLCVAVVKSNYKAVKENVVEFENQDIANYIIGFNHGDTQNDIGRLVHFGSNVIPLEIVYTKNTNDVEQIKERVRANKQIIVDNTWFTSKAGAKAAVDAIERGENIGDKYILESKEVKMVKLMSYNMSLVTGISPFIERDKIELYTRLR